MNTFGRISHKFRDISIRNKLIIVYVITILIPMLIIHYTFYKNSAHLIETEVQSSLQNLTRQININIEASLKQMDNITALLYSEISTDDHSLEKILAKKHYTEADGLELIEDNKEFDKFFLYLLNQAIDIESIYVFTLNKNVFYRSYSSQMKSDYTPDAEEWYNETLRNKGRICIFGVHKPWPLINSRTEVFSMSREIRSMDGKTIAVILLDIKLDSLSKVIQKFVNNYNTKFILVDDRNNVLFSDERNEVGNPLNSEAKSLMAASDGISKKIYKSNKVLISFNNSGLSNWKLISMTPEKETGTKTRQVLQLNILITLASVITYSTLVLLLYLTIYKPILKLNFSMKKAGTGDLTVRVSEDSNDEIGELNVNFNKMITKINQLIESEYKANVIKKDAELKALQSQINPHFLYNTLESISSIAVVKKVSEINEISKSLGYMLRYSIKTEGDIVPFEQELKHVESYIAIQKIRMGDKVTVILDIDENILNCRILKLVLQPLMENAFNHGILNKKGRSLIELSCILADESIVIRIKDDGVGIEGEKLALIKQLIDNNQNTSLINSKESSIGIHNVISRLALIYGSKYDLNVESSPGAGTIVTLVIPAIKL